MDRESPRLRIRLMQAVSDLIYAHHWKILGICLAITVFSVFSYSRLGLKLNFVDMLSEDDPAVIHYKSAVDQFGALSFLFIIVESDDLEKSKAYADELAERLPQNQDFVPRVYHKVRIEDYLDDSLLFLKPEELSLLAELFERNSGALSSIMADPGLVGGVGGLADILGGFAAQGEIPDLGEEDQDFGAIFDPLSTLVGSFKDYALKGDKGSREDLKGEMLGRLMQGGEDLPIDISEPYFLDKEKKRLLMLVSSTRPAEDFEWCREYMEYVDQVVAEVNAGFKDPPKTMMTGNAAFMRDDFLVISRDMKVTTAVAFACIMLLFAFSFRNLSSILMVAVPLAVGIIWSFGAAYWVTGKFEAGSWVGGHLTPVTAIFGAILLGLGIDYAILILSRYTEERHRGRSIKQSLDATMTETGVSILTGAVATALAFFSMTMATFEGGREMGRIAGTGIILFVFIMTFGLGSLLVAWDKRREAAGPTQRKFDPKLTRRLARLADGGAPYVVAVLTLVTVFMAYKAPQFKFEYNYLNLEPKNVPSFQLVHKIPEWFGIDTNYGMVISRDLDEDRKLAAELRGKSTVSKVEAISDFIPMDQDKKLPFIRRLEKVTREVRSGLGPDAVPPPGAEPGSTLEAAPMSELDFLELMNDLKRLRDAVGAPGRGLVGLFYLAEIEDGEEGARKLLAELDSLIEALETAPHDKVLANLGVLDRKTERGLAKGFSWLEKMSATEGVTVTSLTDKHPELKDRFMGKEGDFIVYSYPSLVLWEEENLKAVANELREVDPEAMGVAVLFDRILYQLKKDLVRVALIALSVVFVVIFINYLGLWHTVLTLIPLVAGALAMVGTMNLLGWKFNIVNTGMLPLVIGVGVDYGVYVVHRWIAEGKGLSSITPVIESTGRAVSLSAFTTMIGFASVMLSQWRGLHLMGRTLTMGIGFCWVAAVIFLPAILKVIETVKARRGKE